MQTLSASSIQSGHGTEQVMNSSAMRWVYRTVPLFSSLVVAAASFALSFVALRDVAASTKAVPAHLAWLVPIVIDGGVMCASAVIWATAAMQRKRQIFPFFVVLILVALSVVVNAAHAGPSILAKVIAALPPLVLLATLELVAITTRSEARTRITASPDAPASSPPMIGSSLAELDAELDAELETEFDGAVSDWDRSPRLGESGAQFTHDVAGRQVRTTRPSATASRRPTRVRALEPGI